MGGLGMGLNAILRRETARQKPPGDARARRRGKNPIYGGESLRDLKCHDLRRGYAWKLFLIGYPPKILYASFKSCVTFF